MIFTIDLDDSELYFWLGSFAEFVLLKKKYKDTSSEKNAFLEGNVSPALLKTKENGMEENITHSYKNKDIIFHIASSTL